MQRLLIIIFLIWSRSILAAPVAYTSQEREWLSTKPVVRYTVYPNKRPLEYIKGGVPIGLGIEFLKQLHTETGIQFKYVPASTTQEAINLFRKGLVDILPSASPNPQVRKPLGKSFSTQPYFTGATLVASKANRRVIVQAQDLAGLRVAVSQDEDYEYWLRTKVPSAIPISLPSLKLLLDAVVKNTADVAIGPLIALQPMIHRHYNRVLSTAGIVADPPMIWSMAIQCDMPILQSILDKTLRSFTAQESDAILERWLDSVDYRRPELSVLIQYYWREGVLAIMLGLLLTCVAFFSSRARLAAKQAEEEKSRFLAVMSHEIRTAMNAIVGPIDILSYTKDPFNRKELLHTAIVGTQLLLDTVNNLLDLSKLHAKKIPLHLEPTHIEKIIKEVVLVYIHAAQAKNVEIQSRVNVPNVVIIDRDRYRQVLLNLMSNALKFTEQGQVSLEISLIQGKGQSWLISTIRDSGIGIRSEAIYKLFSDYSQVGTSLSGKIKGTGLGLAICKEIVELMGGTINITSQLGQGAAVNFKIPVDIADTPLTDIALESSKLSEPNPEKVKVLPACAEQQPILVIDDNAINRRIIAEQLALIGYKADLQETGLEGLNAWRASSYVAILLDCQMEGMDGYTVARIIRQEEAENGKEPILIFALSARSEPAHVEKCLTSGMNGVLIKPIEIDALRNTLAIWMSPQTISLSTRVTNVSKKGDLNQLFFQTSKEDLGFLRQAVEKHSIELLVNRAHRLRGAALAMKKTEIADLSKEIEETSFADEIDWERIKKKLDKLEKYINLLAKND